MSHQGPPLQPVAIVLAVVLVLDTSAVQLRQPSEEGGRDLVFMHIPFNFGHTIEKKYWPENIAKRYFGEKKVFGMLRDPYERLVAMFRGSIPGYGGNYSQFIRHCDVNTAVRRMMVKYMRARGKDKYMQGCTFIPQSEFFEGRYGISMPVDNRLFPASMNEVFQQHGYADRNISTEEHKDIYHVSKCSEVWSADLHDDVKRMVRKVYKRDFELLCHHFGYCDFSEDTCIRSVPRMCPQKVLDQAKKKDLKTTRLLEGTTRQTAKSRRQRGFGHPKLHSSAFARVREPRDADGLAAHGRGFQQFRGGQTDARQRRASRLHAGIL